MLSVVIPVYKNEETVEELHAQLSAACAPYDYELIFVEDASPDRSAALLRALAASDPRVVLLSSGQNEGQHRAVLRGLKASRGDVAVILDADLQDPPAFIPALVAKLDEGYDAVFAGRRGAYESPFKLFTSRVFKGLLHYLCGVPKDTSMFVAMRRRMVDAVVGIEMPSPFVPAMIGLTGLRNCSIPFERGKRSTGRSAYTVRMRLRIALTTLLQTARMRSNVQQQRAYYAKADHASIQPGRYPAYARRHLDEAVRDLALHDSDRVLDVGCGMGRFTLLLKEKNIRVEGLDVSEELLASLRGSGIPVHCADLLAPPPELQGGFDAIVGFFILHHLPDQDATFRALASLLRPGGRMVFVEPNPYNVLFYFQIFLHPKMRWRNERTMLKMRRGPLAGVLTRAGFDTFTLRRYGFFPPFLYERLGALGKLLERFPPLKPVLPFQVISARRK